MIIRRSTVRNFLTATLMVAFPKAGVAMGGLPLYLSMLWGIVQTWAVFIDSLRRPRGLRLLYLMLIFWITVCSAIELLQYRSFGTFARSMFNVLAVGAIGLIFYRTPTLESASQFLRWMKNAYYFIITYGLAQIAFGSEAIAIQNITATFDESFDEIINKHNIIRGMSETVSKVFSTYQNGNLFGVAIVLCAPLALYVERRRFVSVIMFGLVIAISVYSGSAGAMAGIGVVTGIYGLTAILKGRSSKTVILYLGFGLVAFYALLAFGIFEKAIELLMFRLFDRNLTVNPRWVKVAIWWRDAGDSFPLFIFGDLSPNVAVFEVLPIALLQYFGLPGAFLFYALSIGALKPHKLEHYKVGVIAYLVMSIADGGYWLTPSAYLFALNIAGCRILDANPRLIERTRLRVKFELAPNVRPRSHVALQAEPVRLTGD